MPEPARLRHADRVLEEHADPANPTAAQLAESRYALIAHSDAYKRRLATGHDRVDDALAHVAELVLGEDGWWPLRLIDLDSGDVLADEGAWHVDATVAIRDLPPATTTVTVNVTRHETLRYELDGELTDGEAFEHIRSGDHDPAWSRIHAEDIDVVEHRVERPPPAPDRDVAEAA